MAIFKVHARTVDMLGRQQIAGIPTAISELFKNAHDAYANNVEVDYFRDNGFFVLRDDGLGMTRDDFENRWLTLGTDSKLGRKGGLEPPPVDPDQPIRPVLGEKGIGRLAIATIGPQVLVVTRAKRGDTLSSTTVAYLNWGLFELPGLGIHDIDLPVREITGGQLPDKDFIKGMTDEVKDYIASLLKSGRIDRELHQSLNYDIDAFEVDPADAANYLTGPTLLGDGHGTHFYIQPADRLIEEDIDGVNDPYKAPPMERMLLGFTNTMKPQQERPPVIARFRDHIDYGDPMERVGERAFFTPDEFKSADHHFEGRFDEYGHFDGTVAVYQMKPEEYHLNWSESDGLPTACGPFSFSFAYTQGVASESLLSPEEHTRIIKKLKKIGGIYIYRNGIRILPYGDSDYDWLDIERRRTLSASYYFYSYRRMISYVELTGAQNAALTEKAGREGFRENRAYRQFRSILTNFFLQTAGDFFRETGSRFELYGQTKKDIERNYRLRDKKSKQSRQKKAALQAQLDSFFKGLGDAKTADAVTHAYRETESQISGILRQPGNPAAKAARLLELEQAFKRKVADLRQSVTFSKPRGVGLSKGLTNEWSAYLSELEKLEHNCFQPAEDHIAGVITSASTEHNLPIDHVARLNTLIQVERDDRLKRIRQVQKETTEAVNDIRQRVQDEIQESFNEVAEAFSRAVNELTALTTGQIDPEGFSEIRHRLEKSVLDTAEAKSRQMERLRDNLYAFNRIWEDDGYSADELTEALEEELTALQERRDSDLELLQLGMAINTISHEFEKVIGGLRDGFRKLKAWAEVNPDMVPLYSDMRSGFEHLDGYMTLFTPFDRRLYRQPIVITGKAIAKYLEDLFEPRFGRHAITFKISSAFLKAEITGFPSSFYPVFVNLVDNAIFWLQTIHDRKREIILDVKGNDFYIIDNGPGVSSRDIENIFELNFSRKPGGRGMGLYISRETLGKIGYGLEFVLTEDKQGATFRIHPFALKNDEV